MLKAMRKNVKSLKPTLWIVIFTFIIAIFAIWGGAGRLGEGEGTNNLVTIGSDKISADAYFQSLRQRLEAMKNEFKGLNRNLIQQLNLPQQVLEQMIQQSLLRQAASDMGLSATDREVRDRIISYPVFQKDGKFIGFQDYKRILEMNRIAPSQFEEGLKQEILLNKVIQILTVGMTVTDEEVWESFKKQNETARIEYLVAEKDKVQVAEKPTEARLREQFEKNKDKYRIPEKRTADYVFFRVDDLKKTLKIEETQIEAYFKDNSAQFQEPERVQVSRIFLPSTETDKAKVLDEARGLLQRARAGEDFAELARKFSKDDKAQAGGDWGLYDWKSLSPKETEAVGKLDKAGISEVLEVEGGAVLFKVTDKASAYTKSLTEVRDQIKGILEDQKARDLAAEKAAALEKLAKREKSLDMAAQKENIKFSSTGALKKGDPLADLDPSGSLSEALFGLKEKEISSIIATYNGTGVAQLQKVEPEHAASLEEVRAEVENDLLDIAKKEKALEKLRAIKTGLKDNWEEAAKAEGLEYKTVEAHKREQYLGLIGENAEVDRLAFSLPLKQVSDPLEAEAGYAIVRVLDRKEVNRQDFEKDKAKERTTLLESKKTKFLTSCLTQLREEKKVRINYNLFLKLNADILSRFSGEE